MTAYSSLSELQFDLATILATDNQTIYITNKDKLRNETIQRLIYTVVFSTEKALKDASSESIRIIAKAANIYIASIKTLYDAFGRNEVSGFTTPALNIRTLTFDVTSRVFSLMKSHAIGAVIFELAVSESEYTDQSPEEYAICVLAGAIHAGYSGPVFLQGDHCQFSEKRYKENSETEIQRLKDWIRSLIHAGFLNIDIDGSTLVDLEKQTTNEQQKENAFVTAELTKYIRSLEHANNAISIGGEIGHIGGINSTKEDFEAFMKLYLQQINTPGISKISVQTGTTHGGTPSKDGVLEMVKLDFSVLKDIGQLARETYHIGGAVQHGASTLPLHMFRKFMQVQTLEVHLATGIQNIILDSLSSDKTTMIHTWLEKNKRDEWTKKISKEQFYYKTRKKVLGPLKQTFWEIPIAEKEQLLDKIDAYLTTIFEQLGVYDTREKISKYFPL